MKKFFVFTVLVLSCVTVHAEDIHICSPDRVTFIPQENIAWKQLVSSFEEHLERNGHNPEQGANTELAVLIESSFRDGERTIDGATFCLVRDGSVYRMGNQVVGDSAWDADLIARRILQRLQLNQREL